MPLALSLSPYESIVYKCLVQTVSDTYESRADLKALDTSTMHFGWVMTPSLNEFSTFKSRGRKDNTRGAPSEK
jgi:hypothetical protein